MSNYESYQNGLIYDEIPQIESSDTVNSLPVSNIKKPLRCHICFFLFFFQIVSTFLMLLSLSFTIKVISGDEISVGNVTVNSGNTIDDVRTDNSFEETLFRFRRLSSNKTWILTRDLANSVCTGNYYANRFKSLSKMRLANCGMFDVSTVVYSFLINESDFVSVTSDFRFPTYPKSVQVADEIIAKLPSQLLTLTHTGGIRAFLNSTQSLIVEHFSRSDKCNNLLSKIIDKDDSIGEEVSKFTDTLVKNHCYFTGKPTRLKSTINCDNCERAYKDWLCTQYFDMFNSVILPMSKPKNVTSSFVIPTATDSENISALIGIKSCPIWCSRVETDCVYFTPAEGNGGEPAFLCDESHYHHNARYKLNVNDDCGVDLPWKFCCYSQYLLDRSQNRLENIIATNSSSGGDASASLCAMKQENCLKKIIQAVHQLKLPTSTDTRTTNCSPPPLSNQRLRRLIIFISSLFFIFLY